MESFRIVLRDGLFKVLGDHHLAALRRTPLANDPRWLQGATTCPPPLMCVAEWPCEGACLIGVCGWFGDELQTVGEIEEFFARVCFEMDQRLGEPAACRWLLNWHDDSPREEVRRELLAEIERELSLRAVAANSTQPVAEDVAAVA